MEDTFPTHPPIKAWRLFAIDTYIDTDGKLKTPALMSPITMDGKLYPNQVYTAKCNRPVFWMVSRHTAPQFDCSCGFYAFKKRKDCRKYLKNAIMAEVLLGGKIIETELGYRAEQMIITKLYWPKKKLEEYVA